jgi:hypothetical protein
MSKILTFCVNYCNIRVKHKLIAFINMMADEKKMAVASKIKALKRELKKQINIMKGLNGIPIKTSTLRVQLLRKEEKERDKEAKLEKLMLRAKKVF